MNKSVKKGRPKSAKRPQTGKNKPKPIYSINTYHKSLYPTTNKGKWSANKKVNKKKKKKPAMQNILA